MIYSVLLIWAFVVYQMCSLLLYAKGKAGVLSGKTGSHEKRGGSSVCCVGRISYSSGSDRSGGAGWACRLDQLESRSTIGGSVGIDAVEGNETRNS